MGDNPRAERDFARSASPPPNRAKSFSTRRSFSRFQPSFPAAAIGRSADGCGRQDSCKQRASGRAGNANACPSAALVPVPAPCFTNRTTTLRVEQGRRRCHWCRRAGIRQWARADKLPVTRDRTHPGRMEPAGLTAPGSGRPGAPQPHRPAGPGHPCCGAKAGIEIGSRTGYCAQLESSSLVHFWRRT